MKFISYEIVFALGLCVWASICLILYRRSRHLPWLAGSTVASCLFLLGATVSVSFFVSKTGFLTPLWLGIVSLLVIHLDAAKNDNRSGKYSSDIDLSENETDFESLNYKKEQII